MELPECPPGAEGYQDSVTEIAKKPENEETSSICTKAEQEFQQHLNSLKIRTEDGSYRCMVERRGRDISGKWIYLCYPCGAMCSGESVLQTHISGKKHKSKLSIKTWPLSIFENHPYIQSEKGVPKNQTEQTYDKVLQRMTKEVENFTTIKSDLDLKYDKYREVRCHIQDTLDIVKAPLIGVEYLIEHPPEEAHYEPSYMCVLCVKQGHPRTIVNHLTCFWHRYNYLIRHFNKACTLIAPYRAQSKYREGVIVIINRLAARIQDKYGRLRPVNIDKEEYEKDRDQIHQWIFKGHHFSEYNNCTFEEVVDADLISSLDSSKAKRNVGPSPPVAAPHFRPYSKPHRQGEKHNSMDSLSDVSDEPDHRSNRPNRDKPGQKRFAPYPEKRREEASHQSNYAYRSNDFNKTQISRPPNYEHKLKLAKDQRASAEELSRKAFAYHEKNPEKHPLYPEEWKKFWNRRYKEIQIEGKDPSKHDFKPEWILFWTTRMKELHEDELRSAVAEIYRRLRLTPPETKEAEMTEKWNEQRNSQDHCRSAERRRSPQMRRSPSPRRRSPEPRRRSPPTQLRRRSPDYRAVDRRSPPRRASPSRRPSPPRRLSPSRRSSATRRSPPPASRRSPPSRRSPLPRRTSPRRRSPPIRSLRTRSRSPIKLKSLSGRKSAGSPLSCRESMPRNQSPSTLQDTVLISDDDLKADDLSPWNSDDTLSSLPDARSPAHRRSRTGSVASRASRMTRFDKYREVAAPQDFGSAENVVATLRLLVALEDYLGSLGPKIVDLLAEALKMEKNKANSSEDLLDSDTAVVLIETAKEKLKGAIQAGLVASGAAAAVRTAIVRAASTLHEADIRLKKKKQRQAQMKPDIKERGAVPVAGVGAVEREQIAQQMAAALIAQGKTDVSSEELAELVEAVVGMAEAKKREAAAKNKTEARAATDNSRPVSNSASALQMLQSAYDDKSYRVEKDVPDAMDGLSDSDLETLLKNFNELSAEEQHSLIAYLKKLEAREPERVERLRQYVSAAANSALTPAEEKSPSNADSQLVTIESDDDDYTVEDVFKSATQKVKEDQIRQEMEIVKKSIEESKEPFLETLVTSAGSEVQKGPFSATELLALVQASLQSTPAPTPTSTTVISDVVASNTQPRSFGDLPESSLPETVPNIKNPILINNQIPTQQMSGPNIQSIMGGGGEDETNESTSTAWEPLQARSSMDTQQNTNQTPRGPQENYNQGSRGPHDNHNINSGFQGNHNQGPQGSYNQGTQGNYNQIPQGNNQGMQGNYNQQGYNDYLQGNFNQGPQENYNQGHQNNYNQGTWEQQATTNNQGPQGNYNLGSREQQNNYNQETQVIYVHDEQGSQDNPVNYNQESQPPQGNFNRPPLLPFNQGVCGSQVNFNQGQRPQNNFNQGQRGPQNYNQPPSLLNNYNQTQDQPFRMRGSFNQGRGNLSGILNQQQFGYQKQNNFRGRGFGGQRGRGRGYY